jgi:hypothetical protein
MAQKTRSGHWSRWTLLCLAFGMLGAARVRATPPPLGGDEDLRLAGNRFQVVASWQTAGGLAGAGHAIPLTPNTGAFWFFAPENTELLVKVLDACGPFGRFWVFSAGLTNVAVTVTVTDFSTGKVHTYANGQGQAFLPIQDTDAFADCPDPTPHACGQGTAAEIAATPRADETAERLALVLGGSLTAWPWLYDRVHADLKSIRDQQTDLASVGFLPPIPPSDLILTLSQEAYAQAKAGTYHAWDCLNGWYSADPELLDGLGVVLLHLRGQFDVRRLQKEYGALPGISRADLDESVFLAPYEAGSFCATVDGATIHYYARPNDYPTYYYFTSQPGATPVRRGTYIFGNDAPPPPDWVPDADRCFEQEVAVCCALS